jgi:hypothetical protein
MNPRSLQAAMKQRLRPRADMSEIEISRGHPSPRPWDGIGCNISSDVQDDKGVIHYAR